MNRVELKTKAKEDLKGKWGVVILAFIILEVATGSATLSWVEPIFGSLGIITIFLIPIQVGYARMHYNIGLGNQENIGDLLVAFNEKSYVRALLGGLLMFLYIIGWMLLLVIPGIIKAIAYSQTFFILQDPDFEHLSGNEAIAQSQEMMKGHKMEFFILGLSFIGWYILVGITFGILLFYVAPYVQQTMAGFYLKLKADE